MAPRRPPSSQRVGASPPRESSARSAAAELLAADHVEGRPRAHRRPLGGDEEAAREDDPDLHPLPLGHAPGFERRAEAVGAQGRLPVDGGGVPVHQDRAGDQIGGREQDAGGEAAQADRPLIAPHLQVDVGHVVVGHGHPPQPVFEDEGAHLVGGGVVPDDPHPPAQVGHAEGPGVAAGAEFRRGAGGVFRAPFRHGDLVDRLARPQRDLPVAAREAPVEVVGDLLGHPERPVPLDDHFHVGGGERVLLGPGRGGRRQEGGEGQGEAGEALQNCTLGTLRASSPISKKSRVVKRNRAATRLVGTVCTALLYDRVLSL